MKKILLLFIVLLFFSMILSGCNSSNSEEPVEIPKETIDETELYQSFLNGESEATIHTEFYGVNEIIAVDASDRELLDSGDSYVLEMCQNSRQIGDTLTFSDLQAYVSAEYENASSERIESSYAYINCNGNSHKSLAVKFSGLNIYCEDDDSFAIFVFNEEDGTLYLTFSVSSCVRNNIELTPFGMVSGFVSAGAGDSIEHIGVLNEKAVYCPVFEKNMLTDIWIGMGINDQVENAYTSIFGESGSPSFSVDIYTIDDTDYYTITQNGDMSDADTEKMKRFQSSSGLNWSTESEINDLINQKREDLQISDDVYYDGSSIDWIPLDTGESENVTEEPIADNNEASEQSNQDDLVLQNFYQGASANDMDPFDYFVRTVSFYDDGCFEETSDPFRYGIYDVTNHGHGGIAWIELSNDSKCYLIPTFSNGAVFEPNDYYDYYDGIADEPYQIGSTNDFQILRDQSTPLGIRGQFSLSLNDGQKMTFTIDGNWNCIDQNGAEWYFSSMQT